MKKTTRYLLISIISIIVILLFTAVLLFYSTPDYDALNIVHRKIAESIVETWNERFASIPDDQVAIVSYDTLMNDLNYFQRHFAEQVFAISPKELGFKGPFFSMEPAKQLKKIESVTLKTEKGDYETGVSYYPVRAYQDYESMMIAMQQEIGKKLLFDSGYRSPGRQAYLYIKNLVVYNGYCLYENAKWIALPGYSEHGDPMHTAVDFINVDGINGFGDGQTALDFEELPEYQWLLDNGKRFNFYLSYPKNNPYGVTFEPWHWHWDGDPTPIQPTIGQGK